MMRRSFALAALVALVSLSAVVSASAAAAPVITVDDTGSLSFAPQVNLTQFKMKPTIDTTARVVDESEMTHADVRGYSHPRKAHPTLQRVAIAQWSRPAPPIPARFDTVQMSEATVDENGVPVAARHLPMVPQAPWTPSVSEENRAKAAAHLAEAQLAAEATRPKVQVRLNFDTVMSAKAAAPTVFRRGGREPVVASAKSNEVFNRGGKAHSLEGMETKVEGVEASIKQLEKQAAELGQAGLGQANQALAIQSLENPSLSLDQQRGDLVSQAQSQVDRLKRIQLQGELAANTLKQLQKLHDEQSERDLKSVRVGNNILGDLAKKGDALFAEGQKVSANIIQAFNKWRVKFGRTYTPAEAVARLNVFAKNFNKVLQLNKIGIEGAGQYSIDGPLADKTAEEFKKMLGTKLPAQPGASLLETGFIAEADDVLFEMSAENRAALEEVKINWRSICTPVKQQSSCGSCWAHTAISVVESAWAMKGNPVTPLSVQQLVDCDTDGQYGCGGGLPSKSFEWLKTHGTVPEVNYKYINRRDTCKVASGKGPRVKSFGFAVPQCRSQDCPNQQNHEAALIAALQKYGPLAVIMDANFLQFADGDATISPASGCKNTWGAMNHAVVLTGYNPKKKAWIVRNSWGPEWSAADGGYFRLAYGLNTCGIANYAVYAQV